MRLGTRLVVVILLLSMVAVPTVAYHQGPLLSTIMETPLEFMVAHVTV